MSARDTTEAAVEVALRRLEAVAGLRNRLSDRRWRHTVSVAETAAQLGAALALAEADRDRAVTAALLHDVAKELSADEQRRAAAPAEPEDERFPALLHARAGARLARDEFGVADPVVLHAVAVHPTGSPEPSDVARLLFVADYLEPTREQLQTDERRLLARALDGRLPLHELFLDVLARKLSGVIARRRPVHPRSVETWNAACGPRV